MYLGMQFFDLMIMEPSSFDLGIGYIQPTPNFGNMSNMFQSKQVEEQLESVILAKYFVDP